jgi:hypothetical protein
MDSTQTPLTQMGKRTPQNGSGQLAQLPVQILSWFVD